MEFVHFGQFTNEGQIWLGIDVKGSVKVDCDPSICSKILFIFITEKARKYFLNGGPKILKNRPKGNYIKFYLQTKCGPWMLKTNSMQICFNYRMTAWKSSTNIITKTLGPGILKTKLSKHNSIYRMTAGNIQDYRWCTQRILKTKWHYQSQFYSQNKYRE